MKRKVFLLALCLTALFSGSLAAQTEAGNASVADTLPTPWRLGVILGVNYTFHQAPQAYTTYVYTPFFGFEGGLSAKYYFKPWLGVRADLFMMMKNYTQTNMPSMGGETFATFSTLHMNQYALLPIMADFSYGKKARIHGGVGFFVGYWTRWSRSGQAISIMNMEPADYDEDGNAEFNKTSDNRFNAGLAGSVGLSFPMGKNLEGSAEVNCYYDLTDSKKVYSRNHFPHYNTVIALQLGICYKF